MLVRMPCASRARSPLQSANFCGARGAIDEPWVSIPGQDIAWKYPEVLEELRLLLGRGAVILMQIKPLPLLR